MEGGERAGLLVGALGGREGGELSGGDAKVVGMRRGVGILWETYVNA